MNVPFNNFFKAFSFLKFREVHPTSASNFFITNKQNLVQKNSKTGFKAKKKYEFAIHYLAS
jgi:hypothetical protein